MIAVAGSFRFPLEKLDEARLPMQAVIEESLKENGCLAYSYAQDVCDPGLFRVFEKWSDRAALDAHFATPHMRDWSQKREMLGFYDRSISVFSIDAGEKI